MDIAFIGMAFQRIIAGLPLTLQLTFTSVLIGLVFAILLGLGMRARLAPLRWLASSYVFVFRGTPLLVQLFLIYYGLGQFRPFLQELDLWWFFRSPYYCVLLALIMNTAAYGAEIVRGGLQSVPAQQVEAARAYGMSGLTLYRRVVGPLALRQALPAYGNELILMVKATALASTVTLMELTGLAHKLISESFRAVEVFLVAGAIYLFVNFILTQIVSFGERVIAPDLAIRPVSARSVVVH
ncbi:MAG: ABC transporter permease [Beijerinckiaceae bacterium]